MAAAAAGASGRVRARGREAGGERNPRAQGRERAHRRSRARAGPRSPGWPRRRREATKLAPRMRRVRSPYAACQRAAERAADDPAEQDQRSDAPAAASLSPARAGKQRHYPVAEHHAEPERRHVDEAQAVQPSGHSGRPARWWTSACRSGRAPSESAGPSARSATAAPAATTRRRRRTAPATRASSPTSGTTASAATRSPGQQAAVEPLGERRTPVGAHVVDAGDEAERRSDARRAPARRCQRGVRRRRARRACRRDNEKRHESHTPRSERVDRLACGYLQGGVE